MKSIVHGFEIEIERKNVKHLNLRVTAPSGDIKLSVPSLTSLFEIESFVAKHAEWIEKNQKRFSSAQKQSAFSFRSGELLSLFGQTFSLSVRPSKADAVFFDGNFLIMNVKDQSAEHCRLIFKEFLKNELEKRLEKFLSEWENITRLFPVGYQIKNVKTYWGKCFFQRRELFFSLRLAFCDEECIEYVVLHELAHLKFPNHQREFKSFLSKHMPDWKEKQAKLKQTDYYLY